MSSAGEARARLCAGSASRRAAIQDVPAIYHFTHGRNLEAIAAAGELRASKTAETAVDIADAKIKVSASRAVACGPGGTLGDYVPRLSRDDH